MKKQMKEKTENKKRPKNTKHEVFSDRVCVEKKLKSSKKKVKK